MRLSAIVVFAGLGLGGFALPAAAAPFVGPVSSVEVVIGTELADKAPVYGQSDLDTLAAYLRKSVTEELARSGKLAAPGQAGARVILAIDDAKPSRPTLQQISRTPSLSSRSRSIGGASIRGEVLSANGARTPIGFRWYEQDIREEMASTTWSDAEHTFDSLARRLGAGDAPLLD